MAGSYCCSSMLTLGLELEGLNRIFPVLSVEEFDLDVCNFIPVAVKTADVDAVHVRRRARIAEGMNTANFTEPVFGCFVSGLVQDE